MPVTIRDIAKKLNLSIGAVSRAMDGYPDISQETRQRVMQAAREMGYVPNRAARQLRRRKADAIGYILPSNTPRFADPFFTEFIAGLGDETARHPFDLLISIAPPGEDAEKQIYQSWIQGRKVDGFILTHLRVKGWRLGYLNEQGVPFTALESMPDARDFPRINLDRQSGVIKLIAHLVERGFTRIACIGGPADLQSQSSQMAGYRTGLKAAGLPFNSKRVMSSDLTSSGGYQATKRLLSIPDPPDAIICINDETAFGVLRASHEQGIKIGQDLAVAGFDGVQASKFTEPPLTSLDIPVYDIACQLVRMLIAEIAGQPLPERQVVLRPTLLVRESTGGNLS
jgi:LacI family transcriptional regulator, galactose operon repressor